MLSLMLTTLASLGPTGWLLSLSVFLITRWYWARPTWSNRPPGPPSLPLLGSLPFLGDTDVRKAFAKLGRQYGPLTRLDLGYHETVVVNGYDTIREVLVERGALFLDRPEIVLGLEEHMHHGVSCINGDALMKQRRFLTQILKDLGVGKRTMEDILLYRVEEMLGEFTKKLNEPFDPVDDLIRAMSTNVSSYILGNNLKTGDPQLEQCIKLLHELPNLFNSAALVNCFPALSKIPGDPLSFNRLNHVARELASVCEEWVQEKKQLVTEKEPTDFVETYLRKITSESNNPNSTFTEKQLVWHMWDLFVAGTDTMAATLSWAILFMILNPDVQQKVYEEIQTVLGVERLPRLADRPKLPYTEAVICEIQRLADVAPVVPRAAAQDTNLRGYHITKGTELIINLHSIHSDPDIFPEPDNFSPERFFDPEGNFLRRPELMPFSDGRRKCLGENLARNQIFLYFTGMMQRFQFGPDSALDKLPENKGQTGQIRYPEPFRTRVTSWAEL